MFVRREEVLFKHLAALSRSESGTVESERGAQRYQLSSSHSEWEREGCCPQTPAASSTQPGNTIYGCVLLNLVTSCRESCTVYPWTQAEDIRTGLRKHRSHKSTSGTCSSARTIGVSTSSNANLWRASGRTDGRTCCLWKWDLGRLCDSGFYPNKMLKWLEKIWHSLTQLYKYE